jgi:hypothetical protein
MSDEVTLANDPKNPRLSELQDEFKRCSPADGFWDRLADNERIRFNLWVNQSSDAKKHGTREIPAKPWEGASDQRVFLADEVINDDVAINCNALWRTLLDVQGVGIEDQADAAVARQVMTWMIHNVQEESLDREVELSAQYMKTYGWTVLYTTWERELALKTIEVMVGQLPPEVLEAIIDPTREDEAIAFVDGMWSNWVGQATSAVLDEPPELSTDEAKRMVTELRTNGSTKIAVPYVCRNEPSIRALRPWVDVFVPDDTGDIQRGRVYVRLYFRTEELDEKVVTEDWNKEWVEAAKKTKGQKSVWSTSITPNPLDRYEAVIDDANEYVEVVYAYSRRINDQGLPAIYLTVFSPHFTKGESSQDDLAATHGILDYWHGRSPFVVLVNEWIAQSITASRGVPEVAWPMQRVEKVEEDSQIDRAALTTLPPRLVPGRLLMENRNLEFGPASIVPILRGEDPKFMSVPTRDGVSDAILARNRMRVDSYFGRLSAEIPPPRSQMRQQFGVSKFLRAWGRAFRQEWALIQQYMSPEEWERITNVPKPQWGPNEVGRGYDLMLAIDVREFDADFVVKKLQAVSQFVLPEDAAGVIDRAKLVMMKLRAIDPILAQQIVVNQSEASQALFQRVNLEVASMFLGNPPQFIENDPTAMQQMNFAQQIVQANPNYTQALQSGGHFSESMKLWADNRMQSVKQQHNKVVGRLGVDPTANQT